MALINRMSRLFTADMHAVLDRIEEPEALLRQAIREMEEEVARNEQRIKWLEHERGELQAREEKAAASLSDLDEQLDVCFESDNEELARKLIRRKLETEQLATALTTKRESTEKTLADRTASLAEYRERLEGMRQKAELLTEEAQTTSFGDDRAWARGEGTVGDDEVEVAFLREKQRRNRS